jgi:hypothetical protein
MCDNLRSSKLVTIPIQSMPKVVNWFKPQMNTLRCGAHGM